MTAEAITNVPWGLFECDLCKRRVDKLYRRTDLKWICEDCVEETPRPSTFVQGSVSLRWGNGGSENDQEAG